MICQRITVRPNIGTGRHQGVGNQPLKEWPESGSGAVGCRERLGGLLNSYSREAA